MEEIASVDDPETEVTPEMVGAGVGVYCAFEPLFEADETLVARMFREMVAAAPSTEAVLRLVREIRDASTDGQENSER